MLGVHFVVYSLLVLAWEYQNTFRSFRPKELLENSNQLIASNSGEVDQDVSKVSVCTHFVRILNSWFI